MKGEDWPILGYADRLSVAPGGTVNVMVSTDRQSYTARVIRLGGRNPEPVEVGGTGTFAGRTQATYTGSYVVVPNSDRFDRLHALTLQTWIFPTAAEAGREQGLITKCPHSDRPGWGLVLDKLGRLLLRLNPEGGPLIELRSERPLRSRNWYFVSSSVNCSTGKMWLVHQALQPWPDTPSAVDADTPVRLSQLPANDAPLLIAAGRWNENPPLHAEGLYDGKIENPSIFAESLEADAVDRLRSGEAPIAVASKSLIASWDFSIGIATADITDTSPSALDGKTVNMPMRATPGHSWRATEQCFSRALDQYGAIHFHSDDLTDATWERDFQLRIPDDLASGAYAVRLTVDHGTDDIPLFILPRPAPRAPIVFVAPTFTYMAYGNTHPERGEGPETRPTPAHLFLAKHPEVGRGLYDYHADLSGCCYTSRLRPIVNMRPDHLDHPRHLPADLLLLEWLERKGYRYDVITDEELHTQGLGAVADYRVVITGSHPEYYSETMLDGLGAYLDGGGNLMYLGGNGFYWVTSTPADMPHVIEVRRGYSGTRTWTAEPGELYHSTTGEFGGLWRHRGRFPNELVGVGFSAQGGPRGSGYARQQDGFRDEVAFIFSGLAHDELIGDFGHLGGPAGDEVDRLDPELGSPPDAFLLASALDLDGTYKIAIEDVGYTIRNYNAPSNPRARADMVFYKRPHGGAVFSVGSIYWFRSLAFNNDDNNVSRVTENVLRNFLGPND